MLTKGLCSAHYDRKRKGSDMNAPIKEYFSTPEEKFAACTMPSTESGCLLWTGNINSQGYGQISVNRVPRPAHRFAWEREHGPIPDGMQVDHLCWVPCCVNVDHLRLVTPAENSQNRAGAQKTSKTGIRGVYLDKRSGAWRPHATVNGKTHRGGLYDDKEEAGRVAAEMRAKLMTHSQN